MSRGVGRRCGLDLVLLWLWHRPVATVPIGPLVWEPPCAAGAALKRQKDKKKKKKKKKKKEKERKKKRKESMKIIRVRKLALVAPQY